jgi:hypothetical protein
MDTERAERCRSQQLSDLIAGHAGVGRVVTVETWKMAWWR